MPYFNHDEIKFNYRDIGTGIPFVFQHGLGGDVDQPCGLFTPPDGIRLISLDFRAHGQTEPVGPAEMIGIAAFADDLLTLLDHLKIDQAIMGGISMGAAVSINVCLRFSDRVLGLVQTRPAWLEGPNHDNAKWFTMIATMLREHGPQHGKELFLQSNAYTDVLDQSSDSAASLARQFDNVNAVERAIRLERIPLDAPYQELCELHAIKVPTLVMANRQDPIHPFAFGERIAERIGDAEFQELTAKSVSLDRHAANVQRGIADFLGKHFL